MGRRVLGTDKVEQAEMIEKKKKRRRQKPETVRSLDYG